MKLNSYIDLIQLLDNYKTTADENRAFALRDELQSQKPKTMLKAWIKEYRQKLPSLHSEIFCKHLYSISLMLGILAFLLGVGTSMGLLSYNGSQPVNLIYILSIAVFIPLLSIILTVVSMYRAKNPYNILVHISPAYWLEKLYTKIFVNVNPYKSVAKIDPKLFNWIIIKRAQLLSLLFSVGLLLGFMAIVATRDIAFAWSTTLDISPEQFHYFLQLLASPWADIAPTAVPSVEIVQGSQYFRLGDRLDSSMVSKVHELGSWWRFLALSIFFYAVLLRLIMLLISSAMSTRVLVSSMLGTAEVSEILSQMSTPTLSTIASSSEVDFVQDERHYSRVRELGSRYDATLGWALDAKHILLLNDRWKIESDMSIGIGGINSIADDERIVADLSGDILLYVKAWEPPTMDIVDMIDDISRQSSKLALLPIGTPSDEYRPKASELNIWSRKLAQYDNKKVWLCQVR